MINKITLVFLFLGSVLHAQNILDEYPKGQTFYKGGEVTFYKEVHDLLKEKKFSECAENEIYVARILVTDQGKVKVIKDSDVANIAKNKCAHQLSLEIIKGLHNWSPAEVKGFQFGAISEFVLYPKDVMSNYTEGYMASNYITAPRYPGGYKAFSKIFNSNFKSLFNDYVIKGDVNLEYYVDENGYLTNLRIYPAIHEITFNQNALRAFQRLKKQWQPALYNEKIPLKYKMLHGLNFSVSYTDEEGEARN